MSKGRLHGESVVCKDIGFGYHYEIRNRYDDFNVILIKETYKSQN